MTISRKAYYKSEILRAIIYPIIFIAVTYILIQTKIYYGEQIDPNIYWNIAVLTLAATLICYAISYTLIKPKKRRRKRR